ncbi:MAG: flagellar hook-associated protein FlgK [Rhodospirillaceae bacterium]|nr:flagellar hook-associated protein FlgK [Rhodospirillaceae bacterium]
MSLNLALTSAISGLSTAQAGLDVISNNIANVNTEGYTRKVFVPESVVLAGNGAGVQIGDIINNVDQNLLRDTRTARSSLGLLATTSSYFKRIQDTFGSPQSNSSISNQLNKLQQEFATLTTSPETVSQQLAAVQAGITVATNLANMSKTVQTLRLNADREIEGAIADVNSYLQNIATLNDQIAFNRATGKQAEDLEDKRDVALNKLSDLMDIRYFKNANGSVTVFTSDGTTLVDSNPVKMSHVALTQVAPTSSYAGGDFNGIFAGVRDITTNIRQGKLKALIDMRDSTLPDMQAQIDQLSKSLVQQVNQVHNRGASYPTMINNVTGTRTFTDSAQQTINITGAEPAVVLYGTDGKEIAFSRVLDTTGINFTNGGTINDLATQMQTWIQAQDPQLVNATVAVNADGQFAINLGTDTIGIAFRDEESAIKGSGQKDATVSMDLDSDGQDDKTYAGFSNFLGLNDYFTSKQNLSQWDSSFKPGNYTTGITAAATIQFADSTSMASGTNTITTITINPGDTLQQIRDKINADPLLAGRITADVIPEGSGQRLRIQHQLGEDLLVTQQGGTDAIDTLGLDFSSTGLSQSMSVNQTLLDDSSKISRGQVQLNPLTGEYLLTPGDNSIASQMAALLSGPAGFQAAGSLSGTNVSFQEYGASIVSRSSTAAAAADTNLKLQSDLKDSLELKQSQGAGVNLDEEMAQLLVFQQSYAASAKVISTTSQLFDILNNLVD